MATTSPRRAGAARRGTLSRAAEFDAVARLGRSATTRYLTLRSRERGDGAPPRLGFAVPRAIGGAVERNAVKRRLREAAARNHELLRDGSDYVVIARPGIAGVLEARGLDWLSEELAAGLQALPRERP